MTGSHIEDEAHRRSDGAPARSRSSIFEAHEATVAGVGNGGGRPTPFPRAERACNEAALAAASLTGPVADRPYPRLVDAPPDVESQPMADLGRRARIFRRLLAGADIVSTAGAAFIAFNVLGGGRLQLLFLVVLPLMVLAAKVAGLYDKDELVIDHSTLNELPRLVNLAALSALLIWIARHYLVRGAPSTVNLLTLWVTLTSALVVTRVAARQLAQHLAPTERCLLVGGDDVFERLQRWFDGYPGVALVSQVDARELARDHSRLDEIIERDHIHRIVIDTDATGTEMTMDTVRLANATGMQVSLLPTILDAVGSSVVFDDIGGLVLLGVPSFGLSRSSLILKRSFDLIAGGLLLILAGPAIAAIAIAIKLDSRGPVLFRQTRMGRNDVPFVMFKFRSMIDGADAMKDSLRHHNEADGGLFKIGADPRITRVGRLLRRSGVDELPQLFNVLAGSMSIVGPRPLVIDEDRHVTGFDRRRLHLTPGITGRWQTLGASRVPLSEMVKIDYLYIANWSPWIDFKIIVETVGCLARRSGQ